MHPCNQIDGCVYDLDAFMTFWPGSGIAQLFFRTLANGQMSPFAFPPGNARLDIQGASYLGTYETNNAVVSRITLHIIYKQ